MKRTRKVKPKLVVCSGGPYHGKPLVIGQFGTQVFSVSSFDERKGYYTPGGKWIFSK